MFSVNVVQGDIVHQSCDLLVLKHADGFFGVDAHIAQVIGFSGRIPKGHTRLVPGRKTESRKIAFVGVGQLVEFEYAEIREFGRNAVLLASKDNTVRRICMPIHGPGYGLDEAEAFSSLVAGLFDAVDDDLASHVQSIEIVEISLARAKRFQIILEKLLQRTRSDVGWYDAEETSRLRAPRILKTFGAGSGTKTRLFVAMPFRDEFNDEWEISIQEASNSLQMISERIDKSAFVGDVAAEIKRRIEEYDGLIALLNGANPNVFLEIGYAWAKSKPTILLAKVGHDLPFDVKGQRCLFYKGIADLRSKLRAELKQLQANGTFSRTIG